MLCIDHTDTSRYSSFYGAPLAFYVNRLFKVCLIHFNSIAFCSQDLNWFWLKNDGKADEAKVEELIKTVAGSVAKVIVRGGFTLVRNEEGSTDSILEYLERAVDGGVSTYQAMCRDSCIVPGAAATKIELARRLKEFSSKETGLDHYAIAKFGESFEMVPKTLAEYAALNAMEIISSLYAEHAAKNTKDGIDLVKDAVCSVQVNQIIMAKPAGGPCRRDAPPGMDEDYIFHVILCLMSQISVENFCLHLGRAGCMNHDGYDPTVVYVTLIMLHVKD
ncbi:hypothetical protein ACFE04_024529 [Oxalis oulophora]